MVQAPRGIVAKLGAAEKGVASAYMQNLVDTHAVSGWEFYRVDAIYVAEKPGCLQSLFGKKEDYYNLNVICFRREKAGN